MKKEKINGTSELMVFVRLQPLAHLCLGGDGLE